MKRILLAFAILLPLVLVIGILYWYFAIFKQPAPEIAPGTKTKPTPGAGFGSLRPYATFCKEFQKVEGEISCEEAIRIATAKYPGVVREISQENNFRGISPSDQTERNIWRLEIKLKTPVAIKQTTFDGIRIFLERKSGEELRKRYRNI